VVYQVSLLVILHAKKYNKCKWTYADAASVNDDGSICRVTQEVDILTVIINTRQLRFHHMWMKKKQRN